MRRLSHPWLLVAFCTLLLAACDVPTPPPEVPTATPGSANPESLSFHPSPVAPEMQVGFTPVAGAPGHIYFVRGTHLWRIEPDGSGAMQLSDLPLSNVPQPSPDGSLVAFTSEKDLYVVPASGGVPRKLASGDLAERQRLGWMANSGMVGFLTYDTSSPGKLVAWAASAKGDNPLQITTFTEGATARGPLYDRAVLWSHDNNWVLVGGADNPSRLLRWPVRSGQTEAPIEIPGGEADWAPDSRTIVYAETMNGALSVYYVRVSAATPFRNEQQLAGTRLGEYAQGPGPRWSPASSGSDSDLIAYRSASQQGEPRVSLRRRGAKELPPLPDLTNNPSWAPSGDRLVVETGYIKKGSLGLEWSPNGLLIARVDPDGGQTVTPLTKDAQWPSWGR